MKTILILGSVEIGKSIYERFLNQIRYLVWIKIIKKISFNYNFINGY